LSIIGSSPCKWGWSPSERGENLGIPKGGPLPYIKGFWKNQKLTSFWGMGYNCDPLLLASKMGYTLWTHTHASSQLYIITIKIQWVFFKLFNGCPLTSPNHLLVEFIKIANLEANGINTFWGQRCHHFRTFIMGYHKWPTNSNLL
jgi:hypothetical protein